MKNLSLFITLTALNAFANAQTKVNILSDSILSSWMNEYKIPAAAIGTIENGTVKTTKVSGEIKPGTPASKNTLFQVASLTKPIVEMTTLRLVGQQLWSLDEPLFHYWTDPDVANDTLNRLLTTRHVITHQTGFVNWRWLHSTGKLTFDFKPGTRTQYSGEGLEYLKRALEVKFKMPLQDIVNRYLFTPTGMHDTRFYWDGHVQEERYAIGYNKEGKPYDIRKNTEASAADLLMTTIADYTSFGASVIDKKGLTDSTWRDMVSIQGKDSAAKFGLGWEVYNGLANDEFALIHGGSDPGVRTIIILLPKSKRGLVIFTNSDNGMRLILKIVAHSLDVGEELIKRAK
jgi:CubicO group peptidase (beta-lactamase class C family)